MGGFIKNILLRDMRPLNWKPTVGGKFYLFLFTELSPHFQYTWSILLVFRIQGWWSNQYRNNILKFQVPTKNVKPHAYNYIFTCNIFIVDHIVNSLILICYIKLFTLPWWNVLWRDIVEPHHPSGRKALYRKVYVYSLNKLKNNIFHKEETFLIIYHKPIHDI